MPIRTAWLSNRENVLLITFEGEWSWEDFYAAGADTRALLSTQTRVAHLIYDLRASTTNISSPVRHLRHFAAYLPHHARSGLHVYIGATTFWKACVTAFTRVYPQLASDIVYVSEFDQALKAIERKNEQLELLAEDVEV